MVESSFSNVGFINQLEDDPGFNILTYLYYYNGGGVAIGDINNDGLQDIYFTSNLYENKLYLNKGNFVFQDITSSAGVAGSSTWTTGVSMADVNGDGLLDIYVCNPGEALGGKGRNELFINNGNLTFTEEADKYGLAIKSLSTQGVFFDMDNDGDLDFFLLSHAIHTVNSYASRAAMLKNKDTLSGGRLYLNQSEKGIIRFKDVTEGSGINSNPISFGLGIGCGDLNNDGYTDIYISNDFHENDYLYINNHDGTFSDQLDKYVKHTSKYGMGNDIGDINNDGLLDIMEVDMMPDQIPLVQRSMAEDKYEIREIIKKNGFFPQVVRNTLQVQNDINNFSEVAQYAGVAATDWSWAPLLADYDNDGNKDIYVTNGIYRRPNDLDFLNYSSDRAVKTIINLKDKDLSARLIQIMPADKISNVAFKNIGDSKFLETTEDWGLKLPSFSNGVAYGDLDNDGDLDIVTNNINETAFLFRNNARKLHPENNFLAIKLEGKRNNTNGIGAKIKVFAGDKMLYQEQNPVRGFISSVTPVLHFGVGNATEIDSLQIVWPGGATQIIRNIPSNRSLTISEMNAQLYEPVTGIPEKPYFIPSVSSVNYQHKENPFEDINREALIPRFVSSEGPGIAVADVNRDGLEDFYVTGSSGNAGKLFIQKSDGSFNPIASQMDRDSIYEGVDAVFFDADLDGDADLYIVTAGNEYADGDSRLIDLLYFNNGNGKFIRDTSAIPSLATNGSCVKVADFDNDGYPDLFIGGRVIAGQYGLSPESYLLKNDGRGRFLKAEIPLDLARAGMVTDACWSDIDNDGWQDLVVVGDWMPIMIFRNERGKFKKLSIPELENSGGWWNCILVHDFDKDGNVDFVVGNAGYNTGLIASDAEPLQLYIKDFDGNGSSETILANYNNGVCYPFATKDQLSFQLPLLKKRFLTYKSFSGTTISTLLDNSWKKDARVLEVKTLGTVFMRGLGKFRFSITSLSADVNSTCTMAMTSMDVNNDGLDDLVTGGNFYDWMPNMNRQDAGFGCVLINSGSGTFESLPLKKSGLVIHGQARKIKSIHLKNHKTGILVARNGERILLFRNNEE